MNLCDVDPPELIPGAWEDPFAADEFAGRVCLVTGAAQGIGGAIATRLAELGGSVAISDVNRDRAEVRAAALREAGLTAEAFTLDVRETVAIDAVVGEIEARWGPVDVLVNNAGLFVLTESVDVTDEEWALQVDVMLTGPFKLSRRVAPAMIDRHRGAIVSISSIGGFGGHPQRTAYNSAKGGIRLMTEVLASEWAPHGVRVNAVAPAVTRTEILTSVIESAGERSASRSMRLVRPSGGLRRCRRLPTRWCSSPRIEHRLSPARCSR